MWRILTVVAVVSLVVQYKLIIDKIKRVRSSLEGMRNHFLDEIGWQRWKLINVFTRIPRVWNAIAEIEVKGFQ